MIVLITSISTVVAWRRPALFDALMFDMAQVWRGMQWYRLFSSGLIHADWMHLLFNMVSLFFFGASIEKSLGGAALVLIYTVGIVVGSITALLRHRRSLSYRALGASGGVCAVIASSALLFPDSMVSFMLLPIPMPAWIASCLFIVASVINAKRNNDGIGHDAHLGGTFAGIIVICCIAPFIVFDYWMFIAAMVACVVITSSIHITPSAE
jgi:membrane associated rhomboid family serine protease